MELIKCQLRSHLHPIDFSQENRSTIVTRLFKGKSNFNIDCKNNNFKHFLNTNIALQNLGEISSSTKFHPSINIESLNGENFIVCKYHLEFKNWMEVLKPMIKLFKNTITEFEKGNAYLASK